MYQHVVPIIQGSMVYVKVFQLSDAMHIFTVLKASSMPGQEQQCGKGGNGEELVNYFNLPHPIATPHHQELLTFFTNRPPHPTNSPISTTQTHLYHPNLH